MFALLLDVGDNENTRHQVFVVTIKYQSNVGLFVWIVVVTTSAPATSLQPRSVCELLCVLQL